MYIQPNTTVRLLTGVPLDNTYAHTIYFANATVQRQYFESKGKQGCLFSNQSYQRYTKGTIRLSKSADDIYDCNYMMFQNTSYGNRWFYAFINNINYISNSVCEIEYEIDVIQTWFFDVTLLRSFVEREHSATDVAGDNIVPEPVNIGDYYMGDPIDTNFFTDYDIVVVSPYDYFVGGIGATWQWDRVAQTQTLQVDNQPTQLRYIAFNMQNDIVESTPNYSFFAQAMGSFPDNDDIACIYLIPHSFCDYKRVYEYHVDHLDRDDILMRPKTFFYHHPSSLSHGYTPKNKKLLTSPYNKLVIDTADGNTTEYAFEFFANSELGLDTINFQIMGYRGINCSFKCVPERYKGEALNFTEGCLLTDFPNVGAITDSFKAWVAQNKTRVALQTSTNILGIGSGMGTVVAGSQVMTPKTNVLSVAGAREMAKGYEQIGRSGVKGIGGTLSELADRSALRYHPNVGSNDGSLEITWGKKDFTAIQYSVNPHNAEIIDDFFNCYGYATHRVKIPNRNVRPHWTYVKTIDINLESNAPADDTNKIASIYDNGITFWANASEVGRYDLDNSPVT